MGRPSLGSGASLLAIVSAERGIRWPRSGECWHRPCCVPHTWGPGRSAAHHPALTVCSLQLRWSDRTLTAAL